MAAADESTGITVEHIRTKLADAFAPTHLTVEDESDGCGSRFNVVVVSAKFEGVGLLDRQRSVNDALKEEMKTIHALSMKTWTPEQAAKKGIGSEAAPAAAADRAEAKAADP